MILYLLAAVVGLGGATIIWSLNDLRAGNIMFDGGSICKFPSINVLSIAGLPDFYKYR